MQCWHELVPPTGVTHSLHGSFTSLDAQNLIVGRASVLQIFDEKQLNHGLDTKLVLVAEFPLSGTITALGKVKLLQSKSGGDALLISFKDAKLSLIEWDPAQHSISTISIHYYENHDLLLCPWTPDLADCVSHLTVDPSSRCAAFNFGLNNVAIIPFHQSGDDLAMDDFDDLDVDAEKADSLEDKQTNGDAEHKTPYAPSFVLPLTALDPSMLNPVDLAFLYEYREPTIGVLFSTTAPSNNMAYERKDVMIYAVYTLDIEQRASTTLLSISKLPNDLYKLYPLPLPVGGTLLVGGNQVVHIDQGGKVNAVAVNEFAKECASLAMLDHSHLRLRLEGCQIERLDTPNGDMLMILSDGNLVLLTFHLDGRSVSSLSLRPLQGIEISNLNLTRASCLTNLGSGRVFVGSEEGDSLLLATSKPSNLKRLHSRLQHVSATISGNDKEGDVKVSGGDDDDADEDDDLYADSNGANGIAEDILDNNFRVLDRLSSIGPVNDVVFGRPPKRKWDTTNGTENHGTDCEPSLELAMACGKAKAGSVAFLQREITPDVVHQTQYENLLGVWSVQTRPSQTNTDDTVILSIGSEDGPATSSLLSLSDGELEFRDGTEFDRNTTTVAVGRLSATNHTVQVSANDIRVYNSDFGLAQIFPIVDEDSGEIAQVLAATIVEPYVVFIKDDQTISVLKADRYGELDEVELPTNVPSSDIATAGLYLDSGDFFKASRFTKEPSNALLFVMTRDATFGVYPLANLSIQIFQYSGLSFLPPLLAVDAPIPKHWKNADEVVETLLADLGDSCDQQPYLTLRTATGDIILYEAYAAQGVEGAFCFRKVATKMADVEDEDDDDEGYTPVLSTISQQLCPLSNIAGYRTVFVASRNPAVLLKTASTSPKIHRFRESIVKHVSSLHDTTNAHGFVYIDTASRLKIAQLPAYTSFELGGQPIRRIPFEEEITKIAYHSMTSTYLLATTRPMPFQLPQDDEWHPEWTEESTSFLPTTTSSALRLVSPSTYTTISSYEFDSNEHILTMKCLALSVSEDTHDTQQLVAVGTAITKGENVVTRGNIYIFSIASVNPDPDLPESDLRIKLVTKEDVRGSVSAITSIGSQGFLLASQGQRAMVRGLKEDKTLLPVAFLDVRFHLSVARELQGTGLTILGDAFSGLWLMGYSEEPYKMQLIARDFENPNVIAADFLPDEKSLYIMSVDDHGMLRVHEYDPESPKTERGTKLLLRSTFNTGSYQRTMTLIPRTPTSSEALNVPAPAPASHPNPKKGEQGARANLSPGRSPSQSEGAADSDDNNNDDDENQDADMLDSTTQPDDNPLVLAQGIYKTNHVLFTSQTGSVSLLTPLSDSAYRRLSTLQNILTTQLDHPCSLNPRAYRAVETDGMGGRSVIDGAIISRWLNLSSWHKGVMAGKVGASIWELRSDVEGVVGAAGLGYL